MKFKKGDLVRVDCDLEIDTYVKNVSWNKQKEFYNGYVFKIVRVYDNEGCYWLGLSDQIKYPKHIIEMQKDFDGNIFGWAFLEEWLVKYNPPLIDFLRGLKDEV